MRHILSLNDLYPKPLVPIRSHDKEELRQMYYHEGEESEFTHWLVALIWCEDEEISGWKVIVFPVTEGKAYYLVPPIFYTSAPSSFDNAWKLSEAVKQCSRQDRLTDKFVHPYWDSWDKIEAIAKEVNECST